jgi:hypothetical protein
MVPALRDSAEFSDPTAGIDSAMQIRMAVNIFTFLSACGLLIMINLPRKFLIISRIF